MTGHLVCDDHMKENDNVKRNSDLRAGPLQKRDGMADKQKYPRVRSYFLWFRESTGIGKSAKSRPVNTREAEAEANSRK